MAGWVRGKQNVQYPLVLATPSLGQTGEIMLAFGQAVANKAAGRPCNTRWHGRQVGPGAGRVEVKLRQTWGGL